MKATFLEQLAGHSAAYREAYLKGFEQGLAEGQVVGAILAMQWAYREPITPDHELYLLSVEERQALHDSLYARLDNYLVKKDS